MQDSSKKDDGKIRLFVAIGDYEGMTPEKMPDFLSRESGITDLELDTIEVFSKFSFVTVPKNKLICYSKGLQICAKEIGHL
jgi:ATP-dependent RNA helicase DeaD